MRQTRGLLGVVLGTHLYGDIGLDTRLLLVYRHIYLESVVKRIYAGVERVACNTLVLVLRARDCCADGDEQNK